MDSCLLALRADRRLITGVIEEESQVYTGESIVNGENGNGKATLS
jgi:hypothetical protein